eukprot:TRINITY_DN22836_c0_g2_i1.p4 TRINITY_DN22836_c0_g2~~TRINITY_DN22836_c0_g2_i1.p4  ORF type:complete len:179 (-),score=30.91 TRINITY_DN22836_c0_g2_i1:115-651(-)
MASAATTDRVSQPPCHQISFFLTSSHHSSSSDQQRLLGQQVYQFQCQLNRMGDYDNSQVDALAQKRPAEHSPEETPVIKKSNNNNTTLAVVDQNQHSYCLSPRTQNPNRQQDNKENIKQEPEPEPEQEPEPQQEPEPEQEQQPEPEPEEEQEPEPEEEQETQITPVLKGYGYDMEQQQ